MAKCIEEIATGHVSRVSDSTAAELVGYGDARYVPKHVWKKAIRQPILEEAPQSTAKPERKKRQKRSEKR